MSKVFIHRELSDKILEASKYFPVITLTGPRQSGKSTLLRHLFNDIPYYSLEDPDIRLFARSDPRGFLSQSGNSMLIDEVQNVPELLSYIQGIVDNNAERKFYLTGSSQFSLLHAVSQSLAGRSAVFELLPLTLGEISAIEADKDLNTLLYSGFYPAIWSGKNIPGLLYPNYVKTYIERDVRNLLAIKDLDVFQRFMRLCAARIGSVFNSSELSNELGVAVNTINSWLSVLQASYIIYMLPPFHTNTRKRLTKSPKLYFTDCGVASCLLDIDSPQSMDRDKMRGHLFENMVIMNYLKENFNRGVNGGLYFYRDSNGVEVDLLVKKGSRFDCIEIKSAATFHPDFTKGIKSFGKSFPDLVNDNKIIYTGPSLPDFNGVSITDFQDIASR